MEVFCPVDLGITDPQGQNISKYESTISDAAYAEMDLNGDSELDDIVIIYDLFTYAIGEAVEGG